MKLAGLYSAIARSGWIVALLLFVAAVLLAGVSAGGPATAEEAGFLLAAESLARDGDLVLSVEDESRMRLQSWAETIRPRLRLMNGQVLRFGEPWIYPALLAPFVVSAPRAGPVVLNTILLAVVILVGARSVRRRTGKPGSWTIVAVVFGSAVAIYLSVTLPVLFLSAVTVSAMALFSTAAPSVKERLDDMYQPDDYYLEQLGSWRLVARALLGGFLVGIVAAHHVLFTLLLLAAPILAGRRAWTRVLPAAVAGAALALLLVWPISGLWPEVGIVPGSGQQVEVSVGSGATGVERAEVFEQRGRGLFPPSPRLLGWNVFYALAGSHVGLLPYFFPLIVLLFVWRRSDRGGLLLVVAALGLCGSFLISPFDFAGLPAAVGNSVFVPFFVSLWWLPIRPLGARGGLLGLIVGLAILWPLWSPSRTALAQLESGASRGDVLDRLPYETTQRDLPVRGDVVTRDLLVRPLGGLQSGGRRGHFSLPAGGHADILVAAPQPLSSIDLLFDSAAGTEVEISGGAPGDMILTPSGGVTFRVLPHDSRIRHPVWWSDESYTFYRLRVRMPDVFRETTFSISSAR
jgi:hypothetical protein